MAQGDIYYFGKIGKEEYNTSNKEYTLEPSSTCLEERIILMGQQIGMSQSIKKGENLNEYIETIGEVIVKYKYINGGEDLEIDWEYKAVEDKEENSGVGEGQSTSTNTSDDEWPESYREGINKLKEKYPNWVFKKHVVNISLDKYIEEVYKNKSDYLTSNVNEMVASNSKDKDSGGWKIAKKEAVKNYINPINFLDEINIFQYLILDNFDKKTQTKEGVFAILNFKEKFKEYCDYFIEAGEKNNINSYYLAAKWRTETGWESTTLSKGYNFKPVGKPEKKVYNMYGIAANDGSGAEKIYSQASYAYSHNWFTKREAIIGGGKFNADDYIRIGQKTMNLIRYNTLPKLYGKHQYGTAISMAKTEAELYHKAYKEIGTLNTKFVFLIPVFNS